MSQGQASTHSPAGEEGAVPGPALPPQPMLGAKSILLHL